MKIKPIRHRYEFDVEDAKTFRVFDSKGGLVHELTFPPSEEKVEEVAAWLGITPEALTVFIEHQAYMIECLISDMSDIIRHNMSAKERD